MLGNSQVCSCIGWRGLVCRVSPCSAASRERLARTEPATVHVQTIAGKGETRRRRAIDRAADGGGARAISGRWQKNPRNPEALVGMSLVALASRQTEAAVKMAAAAVAVVPNMGARGWPWGRR